MSAINMPTATNGRKTRVASKLSQAPKNFWSQESYTKFAEFYQGANSTQEVAEQFQLDEKEVGRRATYLRKGGVQLKHLGKQRVNFKKINEAIVS